MITMGLVSLVEELNTSWEDVAPLGVSMEPYEYCSNGKVERVSFMDQIVYDSYEDGYCPMDYEERRKAGCFGYASDRIRASLGLPVNCDMEERQECESPHRIIGIRTHIEREVTCILMAIKAHEYKDQEEKDSKLSKDNLRLMAENNKMRTTLERIGGRKCSECGNALCSAVCIKVRDMANETLGELKWEKDNA